MSIKPQIYFWQSILGSNAHCFTITQLGSIEVNLFNNGVIETVDINRFNAPKSIDMVNSNAF